MECANFVTFCVWTSTKCHIVCGLVNLSNTAVPTRTTLVLYSNAFKALETSAIWLLASTVTSPKTFTTSSKLLQPPRQLILPTQRAVLYSTQSMVYCSTNSAGEYLCKAKRRAAAKQREGLAQEDRRAHFKAHIRGLRLQDISVLRI